MWCRHAVRDISVFMFLTANLSSHFRNLCLMCKRENCFAYPKSTLCKDPVAGRSVNLVFGVGTRYIQYALGNQAAGALWEKLQHAFPQAKRAAHSEQTRHQFTTTWEGAHHKSGSLQVMLGLLLSSWGWRLRSYPKARDRMTTWKHLNLSQSNSLRFPHTHTIKSIKRCRRSW